MLCANQKGLLRKQDTYQPLTGGALVVVAAPVVVVVASSEELVVEAASCEVVVVVEAASCEVVVVVEAASCEVVVVVEAASCEVVVVVGAGGSGSSVQNLVDTGLRHSTASMPAFLSMKTPLFGSLRLNWGGRPC